MCLQFPFIWFVTDENGRWPELWNKLILNDYEYKGKGVTGTPETVLDNVRTYHALSLKEGAPDYPCPTAPLSYTDLVPLLRKKGVLSSFPSEDPIVIDEVNKVHREQVKFTSINVIL